MWQKEKKKGKKIQCDTETSGETIEKAAVFFRFFFTNTELILQNHGSLQVVPVYGNT